MEKSIIHVGGMSCEHCEKAVKNALLDLSGVKEVSVSLQDGKVTVHYDPAQVSLDAVKNEIIETGYEVLA